MKMSSTYFNCLCSLALLATSVPAVFAQTGVATGVDDAEELAPDTSDSAEDHDASESGPLHIDTYLEPLDGPLYTKIGLEYTARVVSNGMPNADSNHVAFGVSDFYWQTQAAFALSDTFTIRPSLVVGAGSGAGYYDYDDDSDENLTGFSDNWNLTLLDVNQQPEMDGLSLALKRYVIHMISKQYGIFTMGRGDTLDRMATDFLALGSGVNNKFYQTVSGVRLYNRDTKKYLGRVTNGTGSTDDDNNGTGLRLMGINRDLEVSDGFTYTLPYRDWLLQAAYSNTPGHFTDKYMQLGARYTYDVLWARLSVLSQYATSWPAACQIKSTNPEDNDKRPGWTLCQATGTSAKSPYNVFLMGSKMSLGYVDASVSYRTFFEDGNDATDSGLPGRVQDYYLGMDYTFMDATEFGPLTLGLGVIRQDRLVAKVGDSAEVYGNTNSAPTSVNDSKAYGVVFSANQKLGYHSGLRFYTEQFQFSAINDSSSVKIKAEPVRLAALSLYTNIDQWHIDKRH
jgi:hypothetical protein